MPGMAIATLYEIGIARSATINSTKKNQTLSTASLPLPMPKLVSRKVSRFRWLVRAYVLMEGFAALVLILCLAFWIGLAIDWIFEPTPFWRVAQWIFVLGAALYTTTHYLLARIFRPLSSTSLALLLERTHPELKESLVTTVEAANQNQVTADGHQTMLRHTGQEAIDAMPQVRLSQAFNFFPLLWKLTSAIVLVASIFAFSVFQTEAFGFWIQRMGLHEGAWPRRVQLSVVGFQQNNNHKVVHVARDGDYELQVEASILEGHIAPASVEIRYRLADGRRGRDTMTKIGVALPGHDKAQRFRYTFKNVVSDLQFDLIGDDDRIDDLLLHVVERPQIVRMSMECEFPTYLERPPQTILVSGRAELPEGTRGRFRFLANKLLEQASVYDPSCQENLQAAISAEDPHEVAFDFDAGATDQVFLITMLDTDGVENREPYRVVLSIIADEAPEVSVQLRGIGSAITPRATIPFSGQVTDEYGLEKVWFEYQIDKNSPEQQAHPAQLRGRRELSELGKFDLAETDQETRRRHLNLQPGQQLSLTVKASDAYDLQEQPHVGTSQRFLLDIVTNSELRALLEKRELALRQRFEAIYEKMISTRDLLDRIEIAPQISDDIPIDEVEINRRRNRDQLRIAGAMQNVTQLAYETAGVADGFDAIVAELVNNRVDTVELKQRLEQGISEPLREISTRLMPTLGERLRKLQKVFQATEDPQAKLVASIAQAEVVSEAMKEVLDRMLELESYNELVELLRGIVDEQKQLQGKTKQQRREKIRSLLDE